jgi:HD-like signal output (HDOD) protein
MTVLRSAIQRILALDRFLQSDHLAEVVAKIQGLPSLPSACLRLIKGLSSLEATPENVGSMIIEDASLTSKLLELANSAFFSLARPVNSPKDAVQALGFSTVKTLALAISVFSRFDPERVPGLSMDRLWHHSLATGLLARRIVAREGGNLGVIEASFTAGVLHDVGKLIFGFSLPELYQSALDQARERSVPQWQAETDTIGADHGEVGAYLLGVWGLPAAIVEAVAWHHHPRKREPREFCALTAVHIADYVQGRKTPATENPLPVQLDREYVDGLSLNADVSTWEDATFDR